jgi:hypothetical protein
MPVFPVVDTCTFDYVYERTRDYACGEHSLYTTYRIDHRGAASSGTYYYQTSSGCFEASTSDELLPVELVPAETFVAGAYDDVPREGGIVARFVAADDGARVITEMRDEARDAECWAWASDDRCRPVRVAATAAPNVPGATFADLACGVHVGVWTFDDPCPPDATAIYGEGCDAQLSYFEVGAQSDHADVTMFDGMSCEAFDNYGPPFAVGAAIANEDLPPIERAETGTGRLQAWAHVSSAGEPLGPGRGFIDTETGEACRVTHFPDGTARCVPNDAIITSEFETPVFAEAGCTGDRLVRPFSCSPSPDYVLAVDFVYCTGEVVQEVYAVGDVFDGVTAYIDYGDGCMPIDVVPGEYMRQGPAVPASTFAAVSEAVE